MEIDGRHLANISGDSVFAYISGGSLSADISGQTVIAEISGQFVYIDTSGMTIDVSGQTVIAEVSGQTVISEVSGQTVISEVSGQTVIAEVSGQTVIAEVSGQSVVVDISGQLVQSQLVSSDLLPASLSTSGHFTVAFSEIYRKLHASTTTPLTSGDTYTSTPEDATAFAKIHGTVYSDIDGTLYLDQSPDGSNWDCTNRMVTASGVGLRFNSDIDGVSVRVRYVNGGDDQTAFRLYAWLRVV